MGPYLNEEHVSNAQIVAEFHQSHKKYTGIYAGLNLVIL